MSHVAKINMKFKDLKALKSACEAIGLEFKENQKTFKWFGKWINDYHAKDAAYHHGVKPDNYGKCNHAIGVKGNDRAYEIGVIEEENGEYNLIWDFYAGGRGLEKVAGKNCNNLKQSYANEIVTNKTKSLIYQGWKMKRKQVNKEIHINLEKY